MVVRPGLAEVLGHQPAVGVQHLAVPQPDFRPLGTLHSQTNDAGEVLAEVEHLRAGLQESSEHGSFQRRSAAAKVAT